MSVLIQRHASTLAVMLLNLIALGLAAWTLRDRRADVVRILPPPTASPAPSATPVRLHVYVSGAVAAPDVVVLGEGARAGDAVTAAGGFGEGADRAAVNLAAPLLDGQQLHVPAVGEAGAPPAAAGVGGAGPMAGMAGGGSRAGADGPMASGSAGGSTLAGAAVDINRAGAAEIEALPGIGPALAARIVDYRAANGPFRSPQDLLNVSGIGDKTLARFADRIAVR